MRVKMILPALTEAVSPFFRPIKYSLFPPLGLATLAAYLPADAEIDIQDEHVEKLRLDDDPELVVIQAYRDFYSWRNIVRGAATKPALVPGLRHAAYSAGWKKFERLWNLLIRTRHVASALPVLETVLTEFGKLRPKSPQLGNSPVTPPIKAGRSKLPDATVQHLP